MRQTGGKVRFGIVFSNNILHWIEKKNLSGEKKTGYTNQQLKKKNDQCRKNDTGGGGGKTQEEKNRTEMGHYW